MSFKSLTLSEWQQFQKIEINFHKKLTILTGANGSGKTTILGNILARHSDWNVQSCSTPKRNIKSGVFSFLSRLFNGEDISDNKVIGSIEYENNHTASLQLPDSNVVQYQVQISGQQPVQCFFIPSHRSTFRYEPIKNIPFGRKDRQAAFTDVYNASRVKYVGGSTQSTSFFMKSSLISWAIQGYGVQGDGMEIMSPDVELIEYFEGFRDVLRKLLPKPLGFENLEIRRREIVFICNGGADEFILEQVSGGLSALIEIAWQIFMFSTKEKSDYTVIIDEVENHLHPTMQRQILPDLLKAFPRARFIVSTHSPLIVGSVQDSNVYILKYNENGKIISETLDLVNQAKTAAEILDEVLGVSFTMPIWAEEKLADIIERYSSKEMTKKEFGNMRKELKLLGLEKLMPEAISKLVESENDKD